MYVKQTIRLLFVVLLSPLWNSCSTDAKVEETPTLVLNEVCATSGAEWIEIRNLDMSKSADISGFSIVYQNPDNHEFTLGIAPKGTSVAPEGYYVFEKSNGTLSGGFSMDRRVIIHLVSAKDETVCTFNRDVEVGVNAPHPEPGSYALFYQESEGSGDSVVSNLVPDLWETTEIPTKGFDNQRTVIPPPPPESKLQKAIWMWTSHWTGLETKADFTRLANNGITHLLFNEGANGSGISGFGEAAFINRVNLAISAGLKVHIWFQCFYSNGSWVNPINTSTRQINQTYFDGLIARAEKYVRYGNITGIHLDYIRFPGTAYNYGYSVEVNGPAAITEFCRQLNVAVKAIDPNVILSAALMNETTQNSYYYGQDAQKMSQYIDVLMPMVYRYHWRSGAQDHGDDWVFRVTKWFADQVKEAGYPNREVWAGIQTYTVQGPNDSPVSRLSAIDLERDCRVLLRRDGSLTGDRTGATGVVLFRYDLVNYFDLKLLNPYFD